MNKVKTLVIGGIAAAGLAVSLTACDKGSVSAAPNSAAPSTSSGASSNSPSTFGVGQSVSIKDSSGDSLVVTLVKVTDPDQATDGFSTPPHGDRFVSVEIRVKNVGTSSFDSNPLNVSAADKSGQSLNYDGPMSVSSGAEMQVQTLLPGDTALGEVTFDVPTGHSISSVQYQADLMSDPAQWNL